MKRIISCFMTIILIFALVACSKETTSQICDNCKSTNSQDAKFCSNCGENFLTTIESKRTYNTETTTKEESTRIETKTEESTVSETTKKSPESITKKAPENTTKEPIPATEKPTNTNSGYDKDYEKYVMAAHLYQAVIDSAKFPSSVYIERAYYIDNLGQGYPAVRLECAAANSMGGNGILYGVVIQYPIDGYEDNPYADHIYVYDNKYNYECNIYDKCPVVNYNGYEKLNISRIEEVHRDDINF